MSSDATTQAVLTLSQAMQKAAHAAVGDAAFARFYKGTVIKMVAENTYTVSMNDQTADIPVYGSGVFKPFQQVWIIAPNNSKDLSKMFILGMGNQDQGNNESDDHQILMQLVEDCANKLDKGAVVQEPGQSTNNVMSQKAVTDLLNDMKFTGVEAILINGNVLPLNSVNQVTIPQATPTVLGVVKANQKLNGVIVEADGSMTVHSVDLMKITQTEDTTIILDGGNAQD